MSAAMRAFVGEIDQDGLRQFVPEELVRDDARGHPARVQSARPILWVSGYSSLTLERFLASTAQPLSIAGPTELLTPLPPDRNPSWPLFD
jgi:hypothetical protein